MKSFLSNLIFISIFSIYAFTMPAQKLKPGFDPEEYIEMLKISAKNYDREATRSIPHPENFQMVYRSPSMGLDNAWELWAGSGSTAVISIRPTINSQKSILVNLCAPMTAASGELQLADDEVFTYKLAEHPRASVHIGWLIGMAFLSKDIVPQIKACYAHGVKSFYITGHSQGGAICCLLTGYLYYLQQDNKLPGDIAFKTYCSASPKPGNSYFGHEYDFITKNGWAFNVVNVDDWVPETPFSLQTMDDLAEANPFRNMKQIIKQQKLPARLFLSRMYNNINNPAQKARKKYEKFLGEKLYNVIAKDMDGLEIPGYSHCTHYVRAGETIVLFGGKEYYELFPVEKENFYTHHRPHAYLFLAEKLKERERKGSSEQ